MNKIQGIIPNKKKKNNTRTQNKNLASNSVNILSLPLSCTCVTSASLGNVRITYPPFHRTNAHGNSIYSNRTQLKTFKATQVTIAPHNVNSDALPSAHLFPFFFSRSNFSQESANIPNEHPLQKTRSNFGVILNDSLIYSVISKLRSYVIHDYLNTIDSLISNTFSTSCNRHPFYRKNNTAKRVFYIFDFSIL